MSKDKRPRKSTGRIKLEPHVTDKALFRNSKLIREVLRDALMEDDLETFKDVLIVYLRLTARSRLVAKTGIPRKAFDELLDPSKEFNPTLSTLGAILKGIAA